MITKDKVTEIFFIVDEFNKNLDSEMQKNRVSGYFRLVLRIFKHNGWPAYT